MVPGISYFLFNIIYLGLGNEICLFLLGSCNPNLNYFPTYEKFKFFVETFTPYFFLEPCTVANEEPGWKAAVRIQTIHEDYFLVYD